MTEPKVINKCVVTSFEGLEKAKTSAKIRVVEEVVKEVCKEHADKMDRYVEIDMSKIEVDPPIFLDDKLYMTCATLKINTDKYKCLKLETGEAKKDDSKLLIIDDSVDQSDIDEMEDLEKELKP